MSKVGGFVVIGILAAIVATLAVVILGPLMPKVLQEIDIPEPKNTPVYEITDTPSPVDGEVFHPDSLFQDFTELYCMGKRGEKLMVKLKDNTINLVITSPENTIWGSAKAWTESVRVYEEFDYDLFVTRSAHDEFLRVLNQLGIERIWTVSLGSFTEGFGKILFQILMSEISKSGGGYLFIIDDATKKDWTSDQVTSFLQSIGESPSWSSYHRYFYNVPPDLSNICE